VQVLSLRDQVLLAIAIVAIAHTTVLPRSLTDAGISLPGCGAGGVAAGRHPAARGESLSKIGM